MNEQKVKWTFEHANHLYYAAKEELCRPVEDVVNHMVCKNSLTAIRQYLAGFAMKHGIEVQPDLPIEDLYEACKLIDNRFQDLKLNAFFNIIEDEYGWLDINRLNQFVERVEKTRKLVIPA
jgi:hypothetical protein